MDDEIKCETVFPLLEENSAAVTSAPRNRC